MKRTVQRQRERDLAAPVNPRSLATLVLPIEYTQILLDANVGLERFLLHDSGPADDRILIFWYLALLSRVQKWQCDGTFKATPLLASQL